MGSSSAGTPPVGLYVHVPFCVSLCPYCDFVVVAGSAARGPSNRIAGYVEAVAAELELRADALDERFGPPAGAVAVAGGSVRPPLASLYLGGGTPTLLPTESIARLVEIVCRRFGLAPGAEVTIEANPGPDERGDARALRDAGVTRVSYGAQSLATEELGRLGRRHGADDVAAAVGEARAARIRSVNLDLLYDVPGQTAESWEATLEAALALETDHLSLYALTLDDPEADGLTGAAGDHLPPTRGARRWRERARSVQDDDVAAEMYRWASERLAVAGFRGYEISNWARPGHESRHNLAYWGRLPVEAVGPGAHAFDGAATRRWNAARLDGWMSALVATPPALPPGGSEVVAPAVALAEEAILGLRLDDGIGDELLGRLSAPQRDALVWAETLGLVEPTSAGGVRLTLAGRLLSNEVFARLL